MTELIEPHGIVSESILWTEVSDPSVLAKIPMVSVHMITYNHAPYIARAIEGVLQQKTNFSFELVIGEDCSIDGTRDIVLEYRKMYPDIIRVIMSNKNAGAKKNSSCTGCALRGKYVAFCEGDDYWHYLFKLQNQVDYMENNPSCGLVHSDYDRYIVVSGKTINNFNKAMNNVPNDNLDISSILRGGKYLYILTCTVMVRRDILFEVVSADPFLYQSERFLIGDTPRWAEIAWRSNTHYIDESLATYTVLPDSASKSKDPIKTIKFGISINELFMYLAKKYNLPKYEYDYYNRKWCQYSMELAFSEKNKELAKEVIVFKQYLSLKEYIYYYGAINILLNSFIKKIIYFKNLCLRKGRIRK